MILNIEIDCENLILLKRLSYNAKNKCYCEKINHDYPSVSQVCEHCAKLDWYRQDLNRVFLQGKGVAEK